MAMAGLAVPAGAEARFHRLVDGADALCAQGRAEEAASLLDLAVRVRPASAGAWNALGMARFECGRLEEALACFRRATAIDPHAASAWGNAGMVLKTLDRFDEAVAAHDRAVALDPASDVLRLNRAVALLRAGRMATAWDDYECRLGRARAIGGAPLLPTIGPDGPDLRGLTVLAVHEEGFGDTLQFVRYVPMLAATGARVLVRAPRPLARLLRGVDGVARVLAPDEAMPRCDYACPFFSFPRAFATTLETIPAAMPYLRADPALVARFGATLPWCGSPLPRIGLAWAGQARPWLPGFAALDRRRSAGPGVFAALAAVDALFVSLQMAGTQGEAVPPPGLCLHDPMPEVTDFADTAALVAHLDAVVTVDTAVAHLAGGMGKPVLLLDRFDSCWRWLSGRSDSPWYPTLTIFRQTRPGAWDEPIAAVAAALRRMAASRR